MRELEEENHRLRDKNEELKSQLTQINALAALVARSDETQKVNTEPVDLKIVNDNARRQLQALLK